MGQFGGPKHVVLEVEIPAIYTADLDDLREYRDDFESESEWLLNCIRIGGPVRLRVEVEGEKDSEVTEVWGHIREARLVEPGRGYGGAGQLTDEQLKDHGQHKLLRDERACEWCMTGSEALRDGCEDDECPRCEEAAALVEQLSEGDRELVALLLRERDGLLARLDEIDRLRAACRDVVANCYCQPSGQHCDVCRPAALALMEEVPDGA